MIFGLIGIAYISLGLILSAILLDYLRKKLGEGTFEGAFIIMYLNVFLWPIFFIPAIRAIKKESKKKQ